MALNCPDVFLKIDQEISLAKIMQSMLPFLFFVLPSSFSHLHVRHSLKTFFWKLLTNKLIHKTHPCFHAHFLILLSSCSNKNMHTKSPYFLKFDQQKLMPAMLPSHASIHMHPSPCSCPHAPVVSPCYSLHTTIPILPSPRYRPHATIHMLPSLHSHPHMRQIYSFKTKKVALIATSFFQKSMRKRQTIWNTWMLQLIMIKQVTQQSARKVWKQRPKMAQLLKVQMVLECRVTLVTLVFESPFKYVSWKHLHNSPLKKVSILVICR